MAAEQQEIIDKLVDRLSKIQWGYVPDGIDRKDSSLALYREFCRRVAHYLEDFSLSEKFARIPKPSSLHRVHTFEGLNVDAIKLYFNSIVEEAPLMSNNLVLDATIWTIWCMLDEKRHKHSEIYEPILRLLERGAFLYPSDIAGVEIAYGLGMVVIMPPYFRTAYELKPLLDLSDEALDKIDEAKS